MRSEQSWLDDARAAYEASTSFVDQNYRKKWEYGLRAFQNEHPPGSKYLSQEYAGRSRIFRPKTRSVIRKNEAAAALTLGNIDSIEFSAENPDDLSNLAAAEALKHVIRYRLSRTIPWFATIVGAMQDAQVQGAVCSYNYWEYETKERDGQIITLKDRPCIKLKPIENIRIDPAADWLDVVNGSPYFIDIIPMYVCDVEAMMKTEEKDGKPKFKQFSREEIAKAAELDVDSTRQIRQGKGSKDIYDGERPITSHSIVWVLKYFMRDGADDWCFYTLGNDNLLTAPRPIEEVYFHGRRPYTIGCTVLEAHKALPDSSAWLARHTQLETNDIANQRLDNVKLVLNKRYIVGRGRQVDVPSLVRNVPGSVTYATNPKEDVVPMEWGDVTGSSYMEQDRLNADFDDLIGNFSPFTKFSGSGVDETLGRAKLAQTGASAMTEYSIQTLIETWVEPTLRQLALLEQQYETDQIVLSTAARNARLFPRFGYSRITDDLLMREVFVKVNVGSGATDPETRLQKFVAATGAVFQMVQTSPPGANISEIVKEIYRNAGYRDGERFFGMQEDPRLIKAMEMIKGLQAEIAQGRYKIDKDAEIEMLKIQTGYKVKSDETKVNAARIDADSQLRQQENAIKERSVEVDLLKVLSDSGMNESDQVAKQLQAEVSAREATERIESEKARRDNESRRTEADVIKKLTDVEATRAKTQAVNVEKENSQVMTNQVQQTLSQMAQTITSMQEEMIGASKTQAQMTALQEALGKLAQAMTQVSKQVEGQERKPVPVKYRKKRGEDGKKSYVIVMSDGNEREVQED